MVVLGLIACERDHRDPSPPVPIPPEPRKLEFAECRARYPLADAPPSKRKHDAIGQRPGETAVAAYRRWDAREAALSKLSLDELQRAANPDEVTMVLRDRIIDLGDRGVDRLAREERHVFAVTVLFMEVTNGGLDQFFFNSTGDLALDARDGLAEIGPAPLADVYNCALAAFPHGTPSRDRATRQAQLADIDRADRNAFAALDESFYAYPDRGDAVLDYIQAHERQLPNATKTP